MYAEKPTFGPVSYAAGEIIIQQGDIPDQFYIITGGRVEVLRQEEAGQLTPVAQLGVGDYFGEVGLVKWIRRIATIRALTDVELIAMDYEAFFNWLDRSALLRQEVEDIIEKRLQIEDNPQPAPEDALPTMPPVTAVDPEPVTHPGTDSSSAIRTGAPGGEVFYPAGAEIIRQGDASDRFFIILEGLVEVFKTLPDGRRVHITRLAEGKYFGEIGLTQDRPRMASVRALSDVRLVVFDQETFSGWLADSPSSKNEIEETSARRRLNTGQLQKWLLRNDDKKV